VQAGNVVAWTVCLSLGAISSSILSGSQIPRFGSLASSLFGDKAPDFMIFEISLGSHQLGRAFLLYIFEKSPAPKNV